MRKYDTLLVENSEFACRIRLNRPDVRNAFDERLIADMTAAVQDAAAAACRVLVISGEGASFCAGADLNWMARAVDFTLAENIEDARRLQTMFAAIAHFRGVTIASVHGAAIGGGAGLAAVCDLVIAESGALFALSEVRLGLVPAVVGPYILQRVGPGVARGLFVTGERFDGAQALRIGLADRLVSDAAERHSAVDAAAARALEAGPHAVATAKDLIRAISGLNSDDAAEITANCIAELRVGPEGQEGVRAFLEKRTPNYAVKPHTTKT